MVDQQTYWLDFSPSPRFGRFRGRIRVQGTLTDETISVGLYDSDGERISWSVAEFAKFGQDLANALTMLREIKANTLLKGTYRTKVGQWLEVIRSGDTAYCSLRSQRGYVSSLEEADIVEVLHSLPGVEVVVNEAQSTFRQLSK